MTENTKDILFISLVVSGLSIWIGVIVYTAVKVFIIGI